MTLATDSSMGQRAFPVYPRVDRYFAAPSAESARTRLTQCLLRGDGPAVLLGAAGCGKTMLLEVIASELEGKLRVVRLASTQLCTRRALLQSILHGLSEPYRDHEEGELRLALSGALSDTTTSPHGVALLVDEAQSLPVRLLEELRLLANTAVAGTPRLRLLLAGSHSLDEAFTAPELAAFNQRIAARCYLEPLTRAETTQYVRAHVAAAGGSPDELFADEAYEAIQLASDGVPRLINQVCDRALMLAVEHKQAVVTGVSIQEAWSDLHQLAAPWQAPAAASYAGVGGATPESTESVIEFGVLDDESDVDSASTSTIEIEQPEWQSPQDDQPAGVWNADEGLLDLSAEEDSSVDGLVEIDELDGLEDHDAHEEDDDADDCIAYAFPTSPFTEPNEARDEPDDSTEGADDQLDAVGGPGEDVGPDEETLADDPFDEPFDEEEVVLDRFAELDVVMPAAAVVTNHNELEFGRMFEALTPAVEKLLRDVSDRIDGPEPGAGFGLLDLGADPGAFSETITESVVDVLPPQAAGETVNADSTDDGEVLIVEDDPPETDPTSASRQDYAQLFASLREG